MLGRGARLWHRRRARRFSTGDRVRIASYYFPKPVGSSGTVMERPGNLRPWEKALAEIAERDTARIWVLLDEPFRDPEDDEYYRVVHVDPRWVKRMPRSE